MCHRQLAVPGSGVQLNSAFSAATLNSQNLETDAIPQFLFVVTRASSYLARSIFRPALLKGVNIIYSGFTYKM